MNFVFCTSHDQLINKGWIVAHLQEDFLLIFVLDSFEVDKVKKQNIFFWFPTFLFEMRLKDGDPVGQMQLLLAKLEQKSGSNRGGYSNIME